METLEQRQHRLLRQPHLSLTNPTLQSEIGEVPNPTHDLTYCSELGKRQPKIYLFHLYFPLFAPAADVPIGMS
jgi:hypothetical protein